jgi:hypothetical protein
MSKRARSPLVELEADGGLIKIRLMSGWGREEEGGEG